MKGYVSIFHRFSKRLGGWALLPISVLLLACSGGVGGGAAGGPGGGPVGGAVAENGGLGAIGPVGSGTMVAAAQPGMATGIIGPDVDQGGDGIRFLTAQVDGIIMPVANQMLVQAAGMASPNAKVKIFGTIRYKDEETLQIMPVSNSRVLKVIDQRTGIATDTVTKVNPHNGESGYFEIVVEVPQNQLVDFNKTAAFGPFFGFSLSPKNSGLLPEPNPYPCSEKPECGKKDWTDILVIWRETCPLFSCEE